MTVFAQQSDAGLTLPIPYWVHSMALPTWVNAVRRPPISWPSSLRLNKRLSEVLVMAIPMLCCSVDGYGGWEVCGVWLPVGDDECGQAGDGMGVPAA
jgi:hypothetical protein